MKPHETTADHIRTMRNANSHFRLRTAYCVALKATECDRDARLKVEDAYYEIVREREPESFVEED